VSAIEVRDLRKRYGELEAVAGVSFAVEVGEVFCLLGPNGAGKTTTTEILEGYRGAGLRRRRGAWARSRIGASRVA
jgi:ABC-2 type transport system ATP-binding protein